MDATITGIDALMAKIEAEGQAVKAAERRGITKACLIVQAYAQEHMTPESPSAPGEPPAVVTGTLKASIAHRVEDEDGQTVGIVGTGVEYARPLEFGTSRMAARPFLYPALAASRNEIVDAIREETKGAMS